VEMVIVPWGSERLGHNSMNLVTNVDEDRREELI